MSLVTIQKEHIMGAESDRDINTDHVTQIKQQRHFADRSVKTHILVLSSGDAIEINNDEVIAKIKLIMKAKDQVFIPREGSEFDGKQVTFKTGKKK